MMRSRLLRGAVGALFLAIPACSRDATSSSSSSPAPGPAAIDAETRPPAPDGSIATPDAAPPPSSRDRAEACFADPSCPLGDARALLVQADDAGEPIDCFRFYYGMGIPRDRARARTCFKRTVGRCEGSSPDVSIATYVTMLIDAQGGPRDLPAATKALDGCAEDITVTSLRDRMQSPPSPGSTYDFCRDNGGTTLTTNDCFALAGRRAESERQQLAKSIVPRLPAGARPLYTTAAAAWTRFAAADAWLIHDTERGGSIREAAAMRSEQIREKERQGRMARLLDYVLAPGTSEAALGATRGNLDAARATMAAAATDDEQRTMIKDAEDAWASYRAAEIALYVAAFGERLGAGVVAEDVEITLDRARIVILRAEAKGLPDFAPAKGGDAGAP